MLSLGKIPSNNKKCYWENHGDIEEEEEEEDSLFFPRSGNMKRVKEAFRNGKHIIHDTHWHRSGQKHVT